MFTGLIEEIGTVARLEQHGAIAGSTSTLRITIAAPSLARQLKTGDSISVSGVCLTALDITPDQFSADLAQETIRRTSLSNLTVGFPINLEIPTRAGTPLGGHVVQGHVDGVGKLVGLDPSEENAGDWVLAIELPGELRRYVVAKGSIAIEGISLTVAKIEDRRVTIAIIPHTYSTTNLSHLKPGDAVNIEVDVLAKYAEKLTQNTSGRTVLTLERLIRAGF